MGATGRSGGLHTLHPAVRLGRQHGPEVQQTVAEIRVLRARPAERGAALAAHALGQAWLVLNAVADLPPRIMEGVCERGAARWLDQQATAEATSGDDG